MGASVEKPGSMPQADTPCGNTFEQSRQKAPSTVFSGRCANALIEYTRLVLRSNNPAPWVLQYSRMLTMLARLCSNSCRLVPEPFMPANTLGFAAASITQPRSELLQNRSRYGYRREKRSRRAV